MIVITNRGLWSSIRYQFCTGRYEIPLGKDGTESTIVLHVRREDNIKTVLKVKGFEPYFYVPKETDTSSILSHPEVVRVEKDIPEVSHDNKPLMRIVTRTPTDVANIREYFKGSREDDIRFVRRFLIDTGIRGGFEGPSAPDREVDFRELKPLPDFHMSPVKLYFDIETYVRGRFPNPESALEKITCVTLYDTKTNTYATIFLGKKDITEKRSDDWWVYKVRTEKQLLQRLDEIIGLAQADVMTAWNLDFDLTYIFTRGKKVGKIINKTGTEPWGIDVMYDKQFGHMGNRLRDVVEAENISAYSEKDKITVDPIANDDYADLYDNHPEDLILKNKTHTQELVEIDRKHKLIEFFWNLKNAAGLEDITNTIHESIMIDTLILRRAHGRIVGPPSLRHDDERQSYEGGLVAEPPKGIQEDIAVFDMSRFYPSIIIGYKLTPETVPNSELAPDVAKELMAEREKLEKQLANAPENEYASIKQRRDTVKFLLNAEYGVFAYTGFRWFNLDIAKNVTEKAREAIMYAAKRADEFAKQSRAAEIKPPIYWDTDSLLMKVPYEKAKQVEAELNAALVEFCKNEGIPPTIKLKYERYYKAIGFKAKKHYLAWMINRDGKKVDEIIIKGMESQRRDSSLLTRELQKWVADAILRKGCEGLTKYILDVRRKLLSGGYDVDYIAIRKTMHKKFEDYKANVDFVRGSKWNNDNLHEGIIAGDYIKLLHLSRTPTGYPPTNIVCYLDKKNLPKTVLDCIDYTKMFEKTVKDKVDDILGIKGISWDEALGTKTLTSFGVASKSSSTEPPTVIFERSEPREPTGKFGGWQ